MMRDESKEKRVVGVTEVTEVTEVTGVEVNEVEGVMEVKELNKVKEEEEGNKEKEGKKGKRKKCILIVILIILALLLILFLRSCSNQENRGNPDEIRPDFDTDLGIVDGDTDEKKDIEKLRKEAQANVDASAYASTVTITANTRPIKKQDENTVNIEFINLNVNKLDLIGMLVLEYTGVVDTTSIDFKSKTAREDVEKLIKKTMGIPVESRITYNIKSLPTNKVSELSVYSILYQSPIIKYDRAVYTAELEYDLAPGTYDAYVLFSNVVDGKIGSPGRAEVVLTIE